MRICLGSSSRARDANPRCIYSQSNLVRNLVNLQPLEGHRLARSSESPP